MRCFMIVHTLKTILLFFMLSILLIYMGSFFGQSGIQMAFIVACVMNGIIYFFSDKIVLRLYKAQPLDTQLYGSIHNEVEDLADRMQIPKPTLWLVHSSQANAFATGRNPGHASIALTTGIIDILSEHELQGVLAHELSHIKNRDILISTMAATIAAAIGYLAYMLRYSAIWGSFNHRKKNSYNNPLLLFMVGLILPFIATLVQLAISRSREYQADETGARITHDPLALASALKKLHTHSKYTNHEPEYAPATALCIVHTLSGQQWVELLSTHPPMEKRIEQLEKLHHKLF